MHSCSQMNTDHSDHAPLHKIGNFTDGFIPNEVRSKSSTPETEIQKLVKEAGFWQDQSVRERENVIKLAMENEGLKATLAKYTELLREASEALKLWVHSDGCCCEVAFSMGVGSHPRHSQECQKTMGAISDIHSALNDSPNI